jgi:hypothetical protein
MVEHPEAQLGAFWRVMLADSLQAILSRHYGQQIPENPGLRPRPAEQHWFRP